jgi:hypothetical protein
VSDTDDENAINAAIRAARSVMADHLEALNTQDSPAA